MDPIQLRLPATSANVGPGFDAVALAMSLFLDVQAETAAEFSIEVTGRNAAEIAALERNLILETYRDLAPTGPPLRLKIHNEIPLGMGCGSSAAALLAGVRLASHFGGLNLTPQQVLEEACVREGHPDNVAACFHGGFTVSAMQGREVTSATFGASLPWRLFLALPSVALATAQARALLPDAYRRSDAIQNIQATALLVSAFALNRPELLQTATRDRLHQPYRESACPLLPVLLPLAGKNGVYSVTLSGAGPSVLLIVDPAATLAATDLAIRSAAGELPVEVVATSIISA
jgi:homoserine kinase